MSGMFHDYIWSVVFYRPNRPVVCNDGDCLVPQFGKLTAFFLYTGIIMLLERPIGNTRPVLWMSKHVPTPVISTLLVLLHLPFAHW
jgi:hypothetical protein